MNISTNNEKAGERVFENVDEALAERIVARARENGGGPGEGSVYRLDEVDTEKRSSVSIVKIVVPVVLILIAIWVCVRSNKK